MKQLNENVVKEVSQMEADSKYRIITIADPSEKEENNNILYDACNRIKQLYKEFYEWINDDRTKEQIYKKKVWLQEESERIYQQTKQQIKRICDDERTKAVMEKGTKVMVDTEEWLSKNAKFVYEQFKNSSFGQNMREKLNDLKQDERVKKNVSQLKKNALKVSEKAYNSLKNVLDEEENDQKEV